MSSRTSDAELQPGWVRWFFLSVADLLFVALLILLACTALSMRLLGDAGIGWHIRTGQLILATHTIPRVDPFSSSMSGQPWFAWEWLYDVLVGWLERTAGLNGVVLITAMVIAGVFSLTFRLLVWRGANVLLSLILVLLAASVSLRFFRFGGVQKMVLSGVSAGFLLFVLSKITDDMSKSELISPLVAAWTPVLVGGLTGFVVLLFQEDG